MSTQSIKTAVLAAVASTAVATFAAPPAAAVALFQHRGSQPGTVHLQVDNETDKPFELHTATQRLTLAPHETRDVRLPKGEALLADTPTPHLAAGSVILTVSSGLSEAKVIIH